MSERTKDMRLAPPSSDDFYKWINNPQMDELMNYLREFVVVSEQMRNGALDSGNLHQAVLQHGRCDGMHLLLSALRACMRGKW